MGLYLDLYLAHLLADYAFQPGRLVAAKRRGAVGLLLHTLIVGLAAAVVVLPTSAAAVTAVIAATVSHLLVELVSIVTYTKTPTRGLYVFLLDQTLHLLCLAAVAWVVSPYVESPTSAFGFPVSSRVLAEACGLLTVVLLGAILSFEVGNSLPNREGLKHGLLRFDAVWASGVAERSASFLLALVNPLLAALPFAPRVALALRRREERDRMLAEGAAGLAICLGSWAFVAALTALS